MKLRLHIERLVLEGLSLDGAAAAQVRASLEENLAELLRGALPPPAKLHGARRLRAAALTPADMREPSALGAAAARSLHGAVWSEPAPRASSRGSGGN